ncbi:hypothetical protein CIB84_009617, partial [Bambusicola thoracicus]
ILVAKDYLFSGSYDRTARCWSVDKEKQIQEFRGHRNCVLTLAHYSSKDVLEEEEEEEEEERDPLGTIAIQHTLEEPEYSNLVSQKHCLAFGFPFNPVLGDHGQQGEESEQF